MPRPPRCRRICDAPQVDTFCPQGHEEAAPILLTLDEYEVIRLVDLEQRTHQQCAAQMDISRSTVQEIYESARRKIAACLVYGRKLVITGGSYRICGGQEQARCTQCCRTKSEETHSNMQQHKGEANMKIAVTYANGQIFQHFGHTEQFKIYEIDGDRIVASEVVDTNGSGHGALAGFLMQHGVNTLICGGIGGGAQQAASEVPAEDILGGGARAPADETQAQRQKAVAAEIYRVAQDAHRQAEARPGQRALQHSHRHGGHRQQHGGHAQHPGGFPQAGEGGEGPGKAAGAGGGREGA